MREAGDKLGHVAARAVPFGEHFLVPQLRNRLHLDLLMPQAAQCVDCAQALRIEGTGDQAITVVAQGNDAKAPCDARRNRPQTFQQRELLMLHHRGSGVIEVTVSSQRR